MKKLWYIDFCRKDNRPIFDYECPRCGWNAINKEGIKEGYCEIIESTTKCICPVCNNEFEYNETP